MDFAYWSRISPPCLQGGIRVGTGGELELEVATIWEQNPLQRGLEVYRGASGLDKNVQN